MNTTECNSSPASLPPAEEPNWQRIEQQHREGRASTRAIARSHGLPDAAIRKHARLNGWMGRASILPALTDDEAGACGVIDLLLVSGQLASLWELPEIINWETEIQFPRGRASAVLFHIDGSVSIVVVKRGGDDRSILSGIGQLALYAMQAGYGLRAETIRRILVVSLEGARARHLDRACRLAGVKFEPLGTVAELREAILQAQEEMLQ